MRLILVVHRYLAVAVGVLMTLWCVSGFVMMYQEMPDVTEAERLAGLEPLSLSRCCDPGAVAPDDGVPAGFSVEMLLGDPVLRTAGGRRSRGAGAGAINLRTGRPIAELGPDEALEVATRFAEGNGIGGTARLLGTIEIDQWTIQTARQNQPAYHFAFDDRHGNEVYVSGASGQVFQATDRRERVLGWLGAVPHWLYPTLLRQNGPLWTEIVIWTSVLGTFLAATGIYVGISRLRLRRTDNRLVSPFRGWWYWHHISGLVFGVLALTWVFSGLLTMNPWGTLSGSGGGNYAAAMRGSVSPGEGGNFLARASANADAFRDYRQLQSAPFNGSLFVIARGLDDTADRFDAGARPVGPLSEAEVVDAMQSLTERPIEFVQMDSEDAYYYGHKSAVELPVFRMILDDAERTRLYVTPSNGNVRAVGSTNRLSRWIRRGLHGLDFAGLRMRPVWDIVVVLLLAGVTAVCATGTWLAFRRVGRDWKYLRLSLTRRLQQPVAE